jgi:hypothetical protein
VAGPSWTSLIGTIAIILVPSGVWLGLVVPDVARAYSWALLAFGLWLPLFSVASLLVTGCSDPGIIPRIAPPEPDEFPNGRPRRVAQRCARLTLLCRATRQARAAGARARQRADSGGAGALRAAAQAKGG